MSDEQIEKSVGALISAVRDHTELLVDKGHIDPDRMRLTIEARKIEARRRIDGGMSQRETAKELGVSQATINADLNHDQKLIKKRSEIDHIRPVPSGWHPLDTCDTPDEEFLEDRWRNNLVQMARHSIELPGHWEKHFGGWNSLSVTDEQIKLAEEAAKTWKSIATKLKEMNHG